tara:strand:- start:41 stop:634 length:594 start_codon:yes stop_codon:yes gene_type:complete
LFPVAQQHYRRSLLAIYESNNKLYENERKEDVIVLGRSQDFEAIVTTYFATRQLYLVGITTRMANRVSTLIERARAEGNTVPQIARLLATDMGFARSRASLVARTETHSACTFANHSYYQSVGDSYGLNMVKRWVATADSRTRPDHANASGQTVPMNEKFNIGGALMDYAGDPNGGAKNVVNCRCVIVYVDERDSIT